MHNELESRGIFLGTVMVGDSIIPGTHFDPALIAESYWKMYTERKDWEVQYN